jgi:cell division protein FtsX
LPKVLCRSLLAAPALAVLLAVAACGGPVPQSTDLVGIGSSPQPVRDRSLEAFLKPGTDPVRVEALADALASHDGVAAWQYNPSVTLQDLRSIMGEDSNGIMMTDEDLPRPPAACFIVIATDESASVDLVEWLSKRDEVASVAYWFDGAVRFHQVGQR